MWETTVLVMGLAVLLASNIWLLRELDKVRSRLEQYQAEVSSLDDRVCQLMFDMEEMAQRLNDPGNAVDHPDQESEDERSLRGA